MGDLQISTAPSAVKLSAIVLCLSVVESGHFLPFSMQPFAVQRSPVNHATARKRLPCSALMSPGPMHCAAKSTAFQLISAIAAVTAGRRWHLPNDLSGVPCLEAFARLNALPDNAGTKGFPARYDMLSRPH